MAIQESTLAWFMGGVGFGGFVTDMATQGLLTSAKLAMLFTNVREWSGPFESVREWRWYVCSMEQL